MERQQRDKAYVLYATQIRSREEILMSILKVIDGITKNLFRIGLSGPQIKNNSNVIECRNSTDADYAILRADEPVGDDDVVTKKFLTNQMGNSVEAIRIPIAFGDAPSKSSTALIPANAIVLTSEVQITTPFSAGVLIKIGQVGNTILLQAGIDNDATAANSYRKEESIGWGAADLAILVTIDGAPAAGEGVITVTYVKPKS